MRINDQDHSLTLVQGHSDSTFSNFFSLKTARPVKARFHVETPWDGAMKDCANSPGHMTNIAAMPKYGINLKTFLRNQKADDPETWYAASGTRGTLG